MISKTPEEQLPIVLDALKEAVAIIEDLYRWEPIDAAYKKDGEPTWRGIRSDMSEGMFEVGNQAGVHPDELNPKLERFKAIISPREGQDHE